MKFKMLSFLLLTIFTLDAIAGESPAPFQEETLEQIEARYHGQPFVLMLWSIHCAPCFSELKMLGEELVAQPDIPVVLVSTDPEATSGEVVMLLQDYGLGDFYSWQFAGDFPERLRYLIDPDWYGELPRSYFYTVTGERRPHTGVISREMLLEWLADAGLEE